MGINRISARPTHSATFIALIALLPTLTIALHEDQAGTFDWAQKWVGRVAGPREALFSTGSQRRRAFVATEEGGIAALNLRTGEVLWRHVLEADDKLQSLTALPSKGAVITLSGDGRNLRAWAQSDGLLMWETSQYNPNTLPVDGGADVLRMGRDFDGDDGEELATLAQGLVQLLSSYDGQKLLTANITDSLEATNLEGSSLYKLVFSASRDHLTVVGLTPERDAVVMLDVGLEDGNMQGVPRTASASAPLSASMVVVATSKAPCLVVLSADGSSLMVVHDVGSARPAVTHTLVASLFPEVKSGPAASVFETEGVGLLGLRFVQGGGSAVLGLDADGSLRAVTGMVRGVVSNALSLVPKGGSADGAAQAVGVVVADEEGAGATMKVLDTATRRVIVEERVPGLDLGAQGGPSLAFFSAFLKKDGGFGFRAMVMGNDATLALIQQGEVVWAREESLSGVEQALFADLPPEPSHSAVKDLAQMWQHLAHHLRMQMIHFKMRMKIASAEESAELMRERRSHGEKLKFAWDSQGFRKLVVVLTRAGKVLGLHNGDGRAVWTQMIAKDGVPAPHTMLEARLPPQDDVAPEILLIGPGSKPHTTRLTRLDAWKGTVLESRDLQYSVQRVVQPNVWDKEGRRVVLLIDHNLRAHAFPATPEASHLLADTITSTYFYQLHMETRNISGYCLTAGKTGATEYASQHLWEIAFPENIVAHASRGEEDRVHTHTRILGDRSTLYKYLNPNTMFVATSPTPVPGAEPHVTAHVVDTVSGKVLYRVRHQGATGPVQAVYSENWVVYHYWNVHAHRNEVSVLEIFDDDAARRAPSLVEAVAEAAIGSKSAREMSSLSLPVVRVLGQSYFFSLGVKAMAVTSTHKGITSKNVLLGTNTDQVLALEKRFLDPRRPTKPTAMDREEGLVPYNPNLPIIPHHIITTNHQISALRGIVTTPSRLESTSLVFAYGMDLFYTRVMPSRMYDTLDDHEFSYALLVATLVSLVVGTLVASVMVRQKELQAKWK